MFITKLIAYRGKSENILKFLCLPEFQFHHTLRLITLQLQRKSNNFHRLTIKTKRILGLKLEVQSTHNYDMCITSTLYLINNFYNFFLGTL